MTETKQDGLTIKQRADAEADRAEAEEPDTEEPAEGEPEPEEDETAEAEEPEPEPEAKARKGKTPQDRFQAAFARFVKTAAECFEILPGDVVVAPYDGVVGIMLPGFAEARTNQNYKRCPTCNGLGRVLTGAVTGDQTKDWHVCPDTKCKGNGYYSKQVQAELTPATGPLAVAPPPGEADEWAEAPAWMGDPAITPAA